MAGYRPRRGGAVPSVGGTSASQNLWRKLSRGGNKSTGGCVAAVRGSACRNDRRMPEEVPRHGAPTRSPTFRTPFRHSVSAGDGRKQSTWGPRYSCPNLQLVHRRVRDFGPERRKGAPRSTHVMQFHEVFVVADDLHGTEMFEPSNACMHIRPT